MCRLFKKTVLLATASLIVACCAKTEKHEAEYLAVQMSKGDTLIPGMEWTVSRDESTKYDNKW